MALYLIPLVVIISSITLKGFAQLQINPNPLRLTDGATSGSVQISCGIPSGVTASTVYVIAISRFLKSAPTTEQSLAKADVTVNQGQAALSGLSQNIATVSGSTTQKSMTLTLTQAKCDDAGTYVCKIPYSTAENSNVQTLDARDNMTVIVSPGNITITAEPQMEEGNYLVGTFLTLRCNGMIGTYDSSIGETWQWLWQYQDDLSLSWMPYPNDKDISKEPPLKGTSSCQYHQISTLMLNLTLEDSQRKYKCIVQAANNQGSSSAEYSLGIVADTELTTPGTSANSGPAKASVTGAIVGGVIGGLILIAIVIVLVYFLWYRKRSSGEKYSARDAEPKPAEPAPYTYPPASTGDVSYAKSNNRFSKNRDNDPQAVDSNILNGSFASSINTTIPPSILTIPMKRSARINLQGKKFLPPISYYSQNLMQFKGGKHKLKNEEGLHYAELDLVRNAPTDNSSVNSSVPTEYASIRLF